VLLFREEKAQSFVSINLPEVIESLKACWSGSGMSIEGIKREKMVHNQR
jgi:hypothetical protein